MKNGLIIIVVIVAILIAQGGFMLSMRLNKPL